MDRIVKPDYIVQLSQTFMPFMFGDEITPPGIDALQRQCLVMSLFLTKAQ